MSRRERIEERLRSALSPAVLEIADESHRHAGGRGMESHFNVLVVSEQFADKGRIDRHRAVHDLLRAEFEGGLHALTLTLRTPDEHVAAGGEAIGSPNCMGARKAD